MFLTFAERVEGQRTTSSSSTAGQGLVSKRQLIAFGPDIDVEIWLYLEPRCPGESREQSRSDGSDVDTYSTRTAHFEST